MIKRMTLLRKREGLSTESFQAHWAGGHAELALSLPGVAQYTQNRVSSDLTRDRGGRTFSVDGIVELCFTDLAAMERAQASQVGSVLIPADEPLFLSGWTLSVVETEETAGVPAAVKVMVPLAIAETGRRRLADALGRSLRDRDEIRGFAIDVTRGGARRPTLWSEPVPPTCLVTLWFADQGEVASQLAPASPLGQALAEAEVAGAYVVDPLVKR